MGGTRDETPGHSFINANDRDQKIYWSEHGTRRFGSSFPEWARFAGSYSDPLPVPDPANDVTLKKESVSDDGGGALSYNTGR